MTAHCAVEPYVFTAHCMSFLDQERCGLGRRLASGRSEPLSHPLERPEQIRRGRAARLEHDEGFAHRSLEAWTRELRKTSAFERHAISRSAADCRRPAHDHVADAIRDTACA